MDQKKWVENVRKRKKGFQRRVKKLFLFDKQIQKWFLFSVMVGKAQNIIFIL